jgi:hypothetical protein
MNTESHIHTAEVSTLPQSAAVQPLRLTDSEAIAFIVANMNKLDGDRTKLSQTAIKRSRDPKVRRANILVKRWLTANGYSTLNAPRIDGGFSQAASEAASEAELSASLAVGLENELTEADFDAAAAA